MGNDLSILYWLNVEYLKDDEKWFSIKDIASAVRLSRDRTGKHLRNLTFKRFVDTRVDGWCNVYRFRR